VTRFRVREWLARSWIVIPSAYVIAALVLGELVPEIDRHTNDLFGLNLSADSARDILSSVASGMITFTGLVVSVAVVVVVFGAGQYTPRLVLRFRRDPLIKHALGIFIAPALYALISLRNIGDAEILVPRATVMVGVLLLIAALFAFFLLTASLLDLLRPRRIYGQLLSSGAKAVLEVYPRRLGEEPEIEAERMPTDSGIFVHRGKSGIISALDRPRLLRHAVESGAVIEVLWRVGGYVAQGGPLFRVGGGVGGIDERVLDRGAIFAEERTIAQDPPFAIRTIVDIALRALSPAVNDPTTAVQALDVLEELLHLIASRDLSGGRVLDEDGNLRVTYPVADWPELLQLALTEIRHYGADTPQVARRMRALLIGLERLAPAARTEAVAEQTALLDAALERSYPDPAERAVAAEPDHMGLGGGMPQA
jgi:uncharacterized membrane protein